MAQVLATGERKVLLQHAADARYVPSGHLVFLRRGLLMAVPFDVTRADGSAGPDTLVQGEIVPSSWSPDGRHLAALKDRDIWVLTVGDHPSFAPLTTTPEEEDDPEFSPDGRSLAYTSNKTGRWEVYVRRYPAIRSIGPCLNDRRR